jgi:transposase
MCLDDYIGADSICRVIAAYVKSLCLSALGFKYADSKETGRPPYDPASMLMLYLYGYLNRIRSSRRLEAETKRNIEVMWLIEKLTPDDKTICNFRKDNAAALRKVFREFSLWCNRQGLYGKKLVAVDGTKIRANSSRKNIHTRKGTEKELATVERKISEYMNALEENDTTEAKEAKLSPDAVHGILKRLNGKKDILQDWLKQIEANDGKEISTVDPDAHIMHQGGDGRSLDACYNVQSVVDSKHKLIVDFDVSTCPNDAGALPKMTESAKEIMGVEVISVVADKGYYNYEDIEECEKNGTACFIPKAEGGHHAQAPSPDYDRKHFQYDKETDCYICPRGARLSFQTNKKLPLEIGETEADRKFLRMYSNFSACKNCPQRGKCSKDKRGREIGRHPSQDALDIVNARMVTDEGRQTFRERKKLVEHPFGTTKHIFGQRQFLCRGQEATTAEQSLTFLAYNFRRVINIFKENGKHLPEAIALYALIFAHFLFLAGKQTVKIEF